jgi:hypothetical protein
MLELAFVPWPTRRYVDSARNISVSTAITHLKHYHLLLEKVTKKII